MRILFFLLIIFSNGVIAQNTTLNIEIYFKDKKITAGETYVTNNGDSVQFSTLKFYLTDFTFIDHNNQSIAEENSYHLVDWEEPITQHFQFNNILPSHLKAISFNLGVDSLHSVAGALGGDLDPSLGMYWAWQSGYINFKLEGTSPSCDTRKQQFQFHIGGFLPPHNAMRKIMLPFFTNTDEKEITLKLDLAAFFKNITLTAENTVMMPSEKAMHIADQLTKIFTVE